MTKLKINKKLAKKISYGNKRSLKNIKYIVIHYTGNKGDTASGNANYFATSNIREAGAHFFVDKKGEIYKSINMNREAWAVGGIYTLNNGAGKYYKKCTNANSVSIELCDCCTDTNEIQKKVTKDLVKYIQKYCHNAKTIIRHWDVNGKDCPAPMIGKNNKKWNKLYTYLTSDIETKTSESNELLIGKKYKVVDKNGAIIRKKATKLSKNLDTYSCGKVIEIKNFNSNGKWGRTDKGWVFLKKLKEWN